MSFFTVVYRIEPLFTTVHFGEIGIHHVIYVYFAPTSSPSEVSVKFLFNFELKMN